LGVCQTLNATQCNLSLTTTEHCVLGHAGYGIGECGISTTRLRDADRRTERCATSLKTSGNDFSGWKNPVCVTPILHSIAVVSSVSIDAPFDEQTFEPATNGAQAPNSGESHQVSNGK